MPVIAQQERQLAILAWRLLNCFHEFMRDAVAGGGFLPLVLSGAA
ncbi:MAG TPA: hypothetical protein PLY87_25130 [Planctomycetaceae bacterium]|nr:hypothetical protein [Planctomycetaceae bacterium]HQZ68406.1 hypothetical protein [Planctomycetaceae bacterium]